MFSYQGSSTHKDNRGSVVVLTEVSAYVNYRSKVILVRKVYLHCLTFLPVTLHYTCCPVCFLLYIESARIPRPEIVIRDLSGI